MDNDFAFFLIFWPLVTSHYRSWFSIQWAGRGKLIWDFHFLLEASTPTMHKESCNSSASSVLFHLFMISLYTCSQQSTNSGPPVKHAWPIVKRKKKRGNHQNIKNCRIFILTITLLLSIPGRFHIVYHLRFLCFQSVTLFPFDTLDNKWNTTCHWKLIHVLKFRMTW